MDSTLKKLYHGDWRSLEFWRLVDRLTYEQKVFIVKTVGGSAIVRRKFKIKCVSAPSQGQKVKFSVMDYAILLFQAGISGSDVAIDGYHLARWKDRGDYTRRNCRFLTAKENLQERVLTTEHRALLRETGRANGKRDVVAATAAVEALRVSDPKRYHDMKVASAKKAGAVIRARKEERDREVWNTRLSRSQIRTIAFPTSKWKTRLYMELSIGKRRLDRFLCRNSSYVERLV